MATIHTVGMGELRYYDTERGDYWVSAPKWEVRDDAGNVIGELYRTRRHTIEYWRDGEMTHWASLYDAYRAITGEEA